MKLVVLLLLSIFFSSTLLQVTMADPTNVVVPSTCDSKCEARCAKAELKDRCLKYCGICCQQCSCVPSGTYGNKSECPCYRDKLSSKGTPKCP
ncbi:Gibberellin regulated protein [Trema orientale]|uniref:Gibberellin regulated protein n=2 Tax=Cannabaceae TaxID=3481 RepID=A0A2P5D0B0_PARAD|nr:Gibberellin regulated protein [Parasponia andersonii]POO00772.1 Gibberellin regulated protein [Trema orientale]